MRGSSRMLGALAAGALALGGCQTVAENLTERVTGAEDVQFNEDGSFSIDTGDGSASFDADGEGGGTITFEDEDGSGQITTGQQIPDNYAIALPSGGTVVTSLDGSQDGQIFQSVLIQYPNSDAAFVEALCDAIEADGWTETSRSTTSSSDGSSFIICAYERGELSAAIQGSLSGGELHVQSIVQSTG